MSIFTPHSRMRDLVADNSMLLPVLSRFGIALGFGDNTVEAVCRQSGVDVGTFLAVANFVINPPGNRRTEVNLQSLINYLKSAHHYFLSYVIPNIRRRMIEAVTSGNLANDLSLHILCFYDEWVEDVRRHLEMEESQVFGYVERLLGGERQAGYSIADFTAQHHPITHKLKEIKELLICHFTADTARVDLLNSLLFDIITCEGDLTTHCLVEDDLFVPAVEKLEQQLEAQHSKEVTDYALDEHGDVILTPRERDIIAAIASGKSNKEIADKLCLSVHTVATHRRNICAKLNLHSASAIAVFAVIHGITEQ